MTFKDFDAEEKLFLRRVIVAFGVVVVCFGILIFNLYNLQIRQHHYYTTRSNENDIKMLPVAPTRGIIYDRNGIPLVRNVTWYDIAVTPYKIADMDALLKQLTPIVDLSPDDIADFRRALKSSSRYRPVVLKNALTDVEIARFAVNQFHFNGVTINSYQDRQYPYGAELAHVLGYVSKINDNNLKALDKKGLAENYAADHNIGKQGIERYYENDLHGKTGYQEVEVDNHGRRSKCRPAESIPASCRANDSPPNQIIQTPTSNISSEVSSLERGICPSSRAFSSRWGVGASVLSSSLSSATQQTLDRLISENDARTALRQWAE